MTAPFIAGVAGTGSMPVNRRDGIRYLNDLFGQYQQFHQQGETERPGWLLEILNRLWQLPGMVNNGGSFATYTDLPDVVYVGDMLEIPPGVLGIYEEVSTAANCVNELGGQSWQRPLLAGMPMPSRDFASFAFPTRPDLAARFKESFVLAGLNEADAMHQTLGDSLVLCLESPSSLVQMHGAQSQGANLHEVAWDIAGDFVSFAKRLPKGIKLAIHLCRGDLNHQSWFGHIDSLKPMVALVNALAHRFAGAGLAIPRMFLPTCAGDVAPSLDESFFSPLSHINSQVDVVLANVHEMRTLVPDISLQDAIDHNLLSCQLAARALGWRGEGSSGSIVVSFSCGGARMTPENWEFGLGVQRGMIDVAGILGPVTPL